MPPIHISQHLKPFRRDSRMWRTDRRTDSRTLARSICRRTLLRCAVKNLHETQWFWIQLGEGINLLYSPNLLHPLAILSANHSKQKNLTCIGLQWSSVIHC